MTDETRGAAAHGTTQQQPSWLRQANQQFLPAAALTAVGSRARRLARLAPSDHYSKSHNLSYGSRYNELYWIRDRKGRWVEYIGPAAKEPWTTNPDTGREEPNFPVLRVYPTKIAEQPKYVGRVASQKNTDGTVVIEIADEIAALGRNPDPDPDTITTTEIPASLDGDGPFHVRVQPSDLLELVTESERARATIERPSRATLQPAPPPPPAPEPPSPPAPADYINRVGDILRDAPQTFDGIEDVRTGIEPILQNFTADGGLREGRTARDAASDSALLAVYAQTAFSKGNTAAGRALADASDAAAVIASGPGIAHPNLPIKPITPLKPFTDDPGFPESLPLQTYAATIHDLYVHQIKESNAAAQWGDKARAVAARGEALALLARYIELVRADGDTHKHRAHAQAFKAMLRMHEIDLLAQGHGTALDERGELTPIPDATSEAAPTPQGPPADTVITAITDYLQSRYGTVALAPESVEALSPRIRSRYDQARETLTALEQLRDSGATQQEMDAAAVSRARGTIQQILLDDSLPVNTEERPFARALIGVLADAEEAQGGPSPIRYLQQIDETVDELIAEYMLRLGRDPSTPPDSISGYSNDQNGVVQLLRHRKKLKDRFLRGSLTLGDTYEALLEMRRVTKKNSVGNTESGRRLTELKNSAASELSGTSPLETIAPAPTGIRPNRPVTDPVQQLRETGNFNWDSGSIVDFHVRSRTITTQELGFGDQEPAQLLQFKVRDDMLKLLQQQAFRRERGIKRSSGAWYNFVSNENYNFQHSYSQEIFEDPNGMRYRFTLPDGSEVQIVQTQTFKGFDGSVAIIAPSESDPMQVMEQFNDLLGIPNRPPDAQDLRALAAHRLINAFDLATARQVMEGKKLTQAEIDESLARIKERWGVDIDEGEWEEDQWGQLHYLISEETARRIAEEYKIEGFIHQLHSNDWIDGALAAVGQPFQLMSSSRRWTEGIGGSGQSRIEDVWSGGTDYVFMRASNPMRANSNSEIVIDPVRLLRRTDHYSYGEDVYGVRSTEDQNWYSSDDYAFGLAAMIRPKRLLGTSNSLPTFPGERVGDAYIQGSPTDMVSSPEELGPLASWYVWDGDRWGIVRNFGRETMFKGRIALGQQEFRPSDHFFQKYLQRIATSLGTGDFPEDVMQRLLYYLGDPDGAPYPRSYLEERIKEAAAAVGVPFSLFPGAPSEPGFTAPLPPPPPPPGQERPPAAPYLVHLRDLLAEASNDPTAPLDTATAQPLLDRVAALLAPDGTSLLPDADPDQAMALAVALLDESGKARTAGNTRFAAALQDASDALDASAATPARRTGARPAIAIPDPWDQHPDLANAPTTLATDIKDAYSLYRKRVQAALASQQWGDQAGAENMLRNAQSVAEIAVAALDAPDAPDAPALRAALVRDHRTLGAALHRMGAERRLLDSRGEPIAPRPAAQGTPTEAPTAEAPASTQPNPSVQAAVDDVLDLIGDPEQRELVANGTGIGTIGTERLWAQALLHLGGTVGTITDPQELAQTINETVRTFLLDASELNKNSNIFGHMRDLLYVVDDLERSNNFRVGPIAAADAAVIYGTFNDLLRMNWDIFSKNQNSYGAGQDRIRRADGITKAHNRVRKVMTRESSPHEMYQELGAATSKINQLWIWEAPAEFEALKDEFTGVRRKILSEIGSDQIPSTTDADVGNQGMRPPRTTRQQLEETGNFSWDSGAFVDFHVRSQQVGNGVLIQTRLRDDILRKLGNAAFRDQRGITTVEREAFYVKPPLDPARDYHMDRGYLADLSEYNATSKTHLLTLPDGSEVRISRFGTNVAFDGTVQILAAPGSDPLQVMEQFNDLLGIPNRPPDAQDLRSLAVHRIVSAFDARLADKWKRKKKVSQAEIDASLAKIKERWGVDVDEGEWEEDQWGQLHYLISEEAARKIAEKGNITGFTHELYSYSWLPQAMLAVGTPFSLLSSYRRWTEGIGKGGQSPEADVKTGGAAFVFTRPVNPGQNVSGDILMDPIKILRRTDWFAYGTDLYGARRTTSKHYRDWLEGSLASGVSTMLLPDRILGTKYSKPSTPGERIGDGYRMDDAFHRHHLYWVWDGDDWVRSRSNRETMIKNSVALGRGELRLPATRLDTLIEEMLRSVGSATLSEEVLERLQFYVADTAGLPYTMDYLRQLVAKRAAAIGLA